MQESKWWGWGDPEVTFGLGNRPGLVRYLRDRFGVTETSAPRRFRVEDVALPPSALPKEILAGFRHVLGEKRCRTDHDARVRHSVGKSYRELWQIRNGRLGDAPDLVLYPRNEGEVAEIFSLCRTHRVAVVPWGGGTSVVGGVNALRGGFPWLAALVTTEMNRLLEVDETSRTAVLEAGASGPEVEAALGARGFSLGHFPQSFEFSTLGGWIAARSAGQNCLGWGNIERMLVSVRVISPMGEIRTLEAPNHACGPDFKQLLLGSEGTCGLILSARVRVHPKPERREYFLTAFPSFHDASEAAREIAQSVSGAALVRVSDEEESVASLAFSDKGGLSHRLLRAWLRWHGLSPESRLSLLLAGFEGADFSTSSVRGILSRRGGVSLGRAPGRHWLRDRFRLPYLRDDLMDQGLFVETLETSTLWHRLPALYESVRRALIDSFRGQPCSVLTHISHLYPDGASLYFTVIGRAANPLEQWHLTKHAASDTIRKHGAAASHHHGIGTDHREYLSWGPLERGLFRQIKATMDPDGLLNPGKLEP
ncbi:MAG: FAD-binding oxidoreductase [Bdellovibrionales bacterium]|nr:FAD-binding oxidoreductase [Bdellovibrionales bacterium]